jgi:hypothetical protein
MELTTSKRVLAAVLSAIVPGSRQLFKLETRKAFVYLALFAIALGICLWVRVPETYLGLMAAKIGAICLALIGSLDAWLTGAVSKPRYLLNCQHTFHNVMFIR